MRLVVSIHLQFAWSVVDGVEKPRLVSKRSVIARRSIVPFRSQDGFIETGTETLQILVFVRGYARLRLC